MPLFREACNRPRITKKIQRSTAQMGEAVHMTIIAQTQKKRKKKKEKIACGKYKTEMGKWSDLRARRMEKNTGQS